MTAYKHPALITLSAACWKVDNLPPQKHFICVLFAGGLPAATWCRFVIRPTAECRSTHIHVGPTYSRPCSGQSLSQIQYESKNPPSGFVTVFQNDWDFFDQILRAYYAFLSTLYYEILFNYLQLWRSYATLSATIGPSSVRFGRWWTFWAHYGGRAFGLKVPNRLGKKCQKISGGFFWLSHTVHRSHTGRLEYGDALRL